MRTKFIFIVCSSLFFITISLFAQNVVVNTKSTVHYILSCQKENSAFGPIDKTYTDVAWTYPAVHALKILNAEIKNPDLCYRNGGKPFMEKEGWKNGPWYWSLNQKANLYKLLEQKGSLEEDFPEGISLTLNFQPRESYLEAKKYSEGVFFDMASLWNLIEALQIMKGEVENREEIKNFIIKRQTSNGGFDDMLGDRLEPKAENAHLMITYNAVFALKALGFDVPNEKKLIAWIQACQSQQGGFCWSPEHKSYSNKPDVWYTWAAIKILKLLGEKPINEKSCLKWLNSLQNTDGGFGDRPGWNSRLYSTFYAVHSIDLLTGDVKKGISVKQLQQSQQTIEEGKYSIFQAHHKSPSGGTDMVDSIAAMKLNFIGIKTKESEVISSNGVSEVVVNARKYAKEKGYSLEIVDCPENYAHRLKWFSGMNGDHCSNILIPPDMSETEKQIYLTSYNEGLKHYSWEEFKEKVIEPMQKMNTLFYPELDFTMMNAYMVYDEGLDGQAGYNAVPAAHFNNIDWVRHFPYKERWLGHLPMIADGDAHGDINKWKPNLTMFRTIYIAKSYHFNDYIDAALNGRAVCVIKMPETNEIRYYGSTEAVDYLKHHFEDWKWW